MALVACRICDAFSNPRPTAAEGRTVQVRYNKQQERSLRRISSSLHSTCTYTQAQKHHSLLKYIYIYIYVIYIFKEEEWFLWGSLVCLCCILSSWTKTARCGCYFADPLSLSCWLRDHPRTHARAVEDFHFTHFIITARKLAHSPNHSTTRTSSEKSLPSDEDE